MHDSDVAPSSETVWKAPAADEPAPTAAPEPAVQHFVAEPDASTQLEEPAAIGKKPTALQIALCGAVLGLLLGGIYLAYTFWRVSEQRKTEAALARALQENAFLPSGPVANSAAPGKRASSHAAPAAAPAAPGFVINSPISSPRSPAKHSGPTAAPPVKAETSGNAPPPAAAVAAPARTPIRVLRQAQPKLPLSAKLTLSTGEVQVRVAVGVSGQVLDAIALSGPRALRKAACDNVRQWRFQPATVNGKPVEDITEVKVSFSFEGDE